MKWARAADETKSSGTGRTILIRRLEREEFDLIAVGRANPSDPNWVVKVRMGDRTRLKDFDAAALGVLL